MITGMSEEYWNTLVKDLNTKIFNLEFERNAKQEEIERLTKELELQKLKLEDTKKELIEQDKYIDKLKMEYDKKLEFERQIKKEVRETIKDKRKTMSSKLLSGGRCNYEELLYQLDEEIWRILDKVEEK